MQTPQPAATPFNSFHQGSVAVSTTLRQRRDKQTTPLVVGSETAAAAAATPVAALTSTSSPTKHIDSEEFVLSVLRGAHKAPPSTVSMSRRRRNPQQHEPPQQNSVVSKSTPQQPQQQQQQSNLLLDREALSGVPQALFDSNFEGRDPPLPPHHYSSSSPHQQQSQEQQQEQEQQVRHRHYYGYSPGVIRTLAQMHGTAQRSAKTSYGLRTSDMARRHIGHLLVGVFGRRRVEAMFENVAEIEALENRAIPTLTDEVEDTDADDDEGDDEHAADEHEVSAINNDQKQQQQQQQGHEVVGASLGFLLGLGEAVNDDDEGNNKTKGNNVLDDNGNERRSHGAALLKEVESDEFEEEIERVREVMTRKTHGTAAAAATVANTTSVVVDASSAVFDSADQQQQQQQLTPSAAARNNKIKTKTTSANVAAASNTTSNEKPGRDPKRKRAVLTGLPDPSLLLEMIVAEHGEMRRREEAGDRARFVQMLNGIEEGDWSKANGNNNNSSTQAAAAANNTQARPPQQQQQRDMSDGFIEHFHNKLQWALREVFDAQKSADILQAQYNFMVLESAKRLDALEAVMDSLAQERAQHKQTVEELEREKERALVLFNQVNEQQQQQGGGGGGPPLLLMTAQQQHQRGDNSINDDGDDIPQLHRAATTIPQSRRGRFSSLPQQQQQQQRQQHGQSSPTPTTKTPQRRRPTPTNAMFLGSEKMIRKQLPPRDALRFKEGQQQQQQRQEQQEDTHTKNDGGDSMQQQTQPRRAGSPTDEVDWQGQSARDANQHQNNNSKNSNSTAKSKSDDSRVLELTLELARINSENTTLQQRISEFDRERRQAEDTLFRNLVSERDALRRALDSCKEELSIAQRVKGGQSDELQALSALLQSLRKEMARVLDVVVVEREKHQHDFLAVTAPFGAAQSELALLVSSSTEQQDAAAATTTATNNNNSHEILEQLSQPWHRVSDLWRTKFKPSFAQPATDELLGKFSKSEETNSMHLVNLGMNTVTELKQLLAAVVEATNDTTKRQRDIATQLQTQRRELRRMVLQRRKEDDARVKKLQSSLEHAQSRMQQALEQLSLVTGQEISQLLLNDSSSAFASANFVNNNKSGDVTPSSNGGGATLNNNNNSGGGTTPAISSAAVSRPISAGGQQQNQQQQQGSRVPTPRVVTIVREDDTAAATAGTPSVSRPQSGTSSRRVIVPASSLVAAASASVGNVSGRQQQQQQKSRSEVVITIQVCEAAIQTSPSLLPLQALLRQESTMPFDPVLHEHQQQTATTTAATTAGGLNSQQQPQQDHIGNNPAATTTASADSSKASSIARPPTARRIDTVDGQVQTDITGEQLQVDNDERILFRKLLEQQQQQQQQKQAQAEEEEEQKKKQREEAERKKREEEEEAAAAAAVVVVPPDFEKVHETLADLGLSNVFSNFVSLRLNDEMIEYVDNTDLVDAGIELVAHRRAFLFAMGKNPELAVAVERVPLVVQIQQQQQQAAAAAANTDSPTHRRASSSLSNINIHNNKPSFIEAVSTAMQTEAIPKLVTRNNFAQTAPPEIDLLSGSIRRASTSATSGGAAIGAPPPPPPPPKPTAAAATTTPSSSSTTPPRAPPPPQQQQGQHQASTATTTASQQAPLDAPRPTTPQRPSPLDSSVLSSSAQQQLQQPGSASLRREESSSVAGGSKPKPKPKQKQGGGGGRRRGGANNTNNNASSGAGSPRSDAFDDDTVMISQAEHDVVKRKLENAIMAANDVRQRLQATEAELTQTNSKVKMTSDQLRLTQEKLLETSRARDTELVAARELQVDVTNCKERIAQLEKKLIMAEEKRMQESLQAVEDLKRVQEQLEAALHSDVVDKLKAKEKLFLGGTQAMMQALKSLSTALRCPICYEPIRDAVLHYPCAHVTCRRCCTVYHEEEVGCTIRLDPVTNLFSVSGISYNKKPQHLLMSSSTPKRATRCRTKQHVVALLPSREYMLESPGGGNNNKKGNNISSNNNVSNSSFASPPAPSSLSPAELRSEASMAAASAATSSQSIKNLKLACVECAHGGHNSSTVSSISITGYVDSSATATTIIKFPLLDHLVGCFEFALRNAQNSRRAVVRDMLVVEAREEGQDEEDIRTDEKKMSKIERQADEQVADLEQSASQVAVKPVAGSRVHPNALKGRLVPLTVGVDLKASGNNNNNENDDEEGEEDNGSLAGSANASVSSFDGAGNKKKKRKRGGGGDDGAARLAEAAEKWV